MSLAVALVTDLAYYIFHYISHMWQWFWPIHSVHHSAQVMTPFTLKRVHPIEPILLAPFTAALGGIFQGLLFVAVGGPIDLLTILGLNAVSHLFYLAGANLRHSHIWIDYGPLWSHILISPAQHQIHHSANPKHHDKNLGRIFALWDWCFGTLYIPQHHEHLQFGLGSRADQPHGNVIKAYVEPFQAYAALLKLKSKKNKL
jgi:sterol desaturase/sphingolipid hydroxylase (fatty acid hydroxylase superfamily)